MYEVLNLCFDVSFILYKIVINYIYLKIKTKKTQTNFTVSLSRMNNRINKDL